MARRTPSNRSIDGFMQGVQASAQMHMKNSPAQRLAWLQDLAGRQVESKEDRDVLCMQLMAFSVSHAWRSAGISGVQTGFTLGGWDEIEQIPGELRRLFERLSDPKPGWFWFPESKVRFGVCFSGPRSMQTGVDSRSIAGPFFGAVMELLAALRGELRRCEAPDCTRLYVAHRPQQRYCERKCQNRTTMSRYLAGKGQDAAANRRARRRETQRRIRAEKSGVPLERVAPIRRKGAR